jgi:aminopeptidase-like protein
VVVGIEVMRRLMQLKKRKYTYRLIVAPEHLGTVFYLNGLSDEEAGTFKYAVFLEMLGTDKKFALQESFLGQSLLDKACHNYLKHNFPEYHSDKFRKIVGNDETVWESPGYEIPCVSLSRMLYPEYHSDKDNADIISEVKLEESVNTVMGIFTILESDTAVNRNFKGLLALSNPKYDLYISTADPSIRIEVTGEQKKWNYLMDCIIRYFDGKTTLLDIAIKHDIEHAKLVRYVEKFRQKQLVSFVE